MIPWHAFKPNEQHPDWRVELNEDNLHNYIFHGPNQLRRGLDSSMLELAHERQFAISQVGTQSVDFEAEHSARIEIALQLLNECLAAQQSDEPCRPTSPYADDLIDLRTQTSQFSPLPSLDLLHVHHGPRISSPSTVQTRQRPHRQPLALTELRNPAPMPASQLKRKADDDALTVIIADDKHSDSFDFDDDVAVDSTGSIKYSRAENVMRHGPAARLRRQVRIRKSNTKLATTEDCFDADELEKDGHLLVNLSHNYISISHRRNDLSSQHSREVDIPAT